MTGARFVPAQIRFVLAQGVEHAIRPLLQRFMRARRLTSSLIDRIVFDDEAETLSISFRESGKYIYHGVPRAIYDALGKAQSAGRYFNEAIKGRFRCEPARQRHRPD